MRCRKAVSASAVAMRLEVVATLCLVALLLCSCREGNESNSTELQQWKDSGGEKRVFTYWYPNSEMTDGEPTDEDMAKLGHLVHDGWEIAFIIRHAESVGAQTDVYMIRSGSSE